MAQGDAVNPPSVPASNWLDRFRPLRRAEVVLLKALYAGEIAKVGLRRPLVPSASVTIRAELLGTVVRGVEFLPLEDRGVQIIGAWIEGRIDLRNAEIPHGLWFYRCVFNTTPRLDGAKIDGSVSFSDCLLPGLRAESCTVTEDLSLNAGSTVRSEVRLSTATIGRDLNCARLRLRSGSRGAAPEQAPFQQRLCADGARIEGNAILSGGFESQGDVRLVGVQIGGDLRVNDARLNGSIDSGGGRGNALNLDRAHIAGRVSLDGGFSAAGTVRLTRSHIEGDLDCSGATFDVYSEAEFSGGAGLRMDRATVGGALKLVRLKRPLMAPSLVDARVGALVDDHSTWGERLSLDGFAYSRFADGAPTSARFRLAWLKRQHPDQLDRDFRPGPWRQLIAVLRRMGFEHGAREVAVEFESHRRRIGRVGNWAPDALKWLPRAGHALFGALVGYGHRPSRLITAMVALWLFGGAVYWVAADQGAMAPTDLQVFDNPRYARCRPDAQSRFDSTASRAGDANWTRCPDLPAAYPAFQPLAYSLDRLLPVVDLQQSLRWGTVRDIGNGTLATAAHPAALWGLAARMTSVVETLFGWIACFILLAAAAELFSRKSDR